MDPSRISPSKNEKFLSEGAVECALPRIFIRLPEHSYGRRIDKKCIGLLTWPLFLGRPRVGHVFYYPSSALPSSSRTARGSVIERKTPFSRSRRMIFGVHLFVDGEFSQYAIGAGIWIFAMKKKIDTTQRVCIQGIPELEAKNSGLSIFSLLISNYR